MTFLALQSEFGPAAGAATSFMDKVMAHYGQTAFGLIAIVVLVLLGVFVWRMAVGPSQEIRLKLEQQRTIQTEHMAEQAKTMSQSISELRAVAGTFERLHADHKAATMELERAIDRLNQIGTPRGE